MPYCHMGNTLLTFMLVELQQIMAASAIAPITGRFRKRIVFDLFGALALGTACASAWWYGHHIPKMAKFRAHDARVKLEVDAENAAFLAAQAQVSSSAE